MEPPPREPPWSEHEKMYLLGEIVKIGSPNSSVLLEIIQHHGISPKWTEIALPHGRSLNSCQKAYAEILHFHQRRYAPQPHLPHSMQFHPQELVRKRAHTTESSTPPTVGRLLQPRPPHPFSTELLPGPAYHVSPMGEPAHRKKRGRPTKAEQQARADEAAARGEVYPPPSKRKSAKPPELAGEGSSGPSASPMTPRKLTVAEVTTSTPLEPIPTDTASESSSGKRRRARPASIDVGGPSIQDLTGPPMESPSRPGSTAVSSSLSLHAHTTSTSEPPTSGSDRPREREMRPEPVEEATGQTSTPRSFKETVGM